MAVMVWLEGMVMLLDWVVLTLMAGGAGVGAFGGLGGGLNGGILVGRGGLGGSRGGLGGLGWPGGLRGGGCGEGGC